ncbi:carboxymuconolactone decarboxylase family protein [Paractinoplanes durhamensis]|uniref:Carboxymuconolactone decarboxylase-like domain-containing protein n=1 Tax=Paractinoplanes durhamensis TaxID=113563 RepID=A0ABQ3ZB88_9ACTN|nr:carboxymuconolactone decarboxylase family protein [Actinoplanes durhamensis]GIE07087.1 hypothetical protein Adu01nite_84370 [Actinoplanes durhamensis]
MRIDDLDPADMTEDQKSLYDWYATGPRAAADNPFKLVTPDGRLQGPPAVWILSPTFGHALQKIGGAVRFGSSLPPRAQEIAILQVAHHHKSPFELYAHERAGAAAGLTPEDLKALADSAEPAALTKVEACCFQITKQILKNNKLTNEEYAEAVTKLGEAPLFELVTVIGYYTMVALQLAVFEVSPES